MERGEGGYKTGTRENRKRGCVFKVILQLRMNEKMVLEGG